LENKFGCDVLVGEDEFGLMGATAFFNAPIVAVLAADALEERLFMVWVVDDDRLGLVGETAFLNAPTAAEAFAPAVTVVADRLPVGFEAARAVVVVVVVV
jgi:hypothetical protein